MNWNLRITGTDAAWQWQMIFKPDGRAGRIVNIIFICFVDLAVVCFGSSMILDWDLTLLRVTVYLDGTEVKGKQLFEQLHKGGVIHNMLLKYGHRSSCSVPKTEEVSKMICFLDCRHCRVHEEACQSWLEARPWGSGGADQGELHRHHQQRGAHAGRVLCPMVSLHSIQIHHWHSGFKIGIAGLEALEEHHQTTKLQFSDLH